MSLRRIALQSMCSHKEEDLALNIIEYNTIDMSCTKIDTEIICSRCGKVIVGKQAFNGVIGLFKKSKYI